MVVSGLPRSGTSMLMSMLDAGGIPPITDNIRTADEDNPKGYYEYERVKALDKGDTAWVANAILGPTPDTPSRVRNRSRASRSAKPYSVWESSLTIMAVVSRTSAPRLTVARVAGVAMTL